MLCTGGKVVFVLVCDFDLNLCEKKWRGLPYGNFHVGGVNWGIICVLHHNFHRREIFVSIFQCDQVRRKKANILEAFLLSIV